MTGDREHRDAGAAPGHLHGRRPRSAHRHRLSRRHADPDDGVRAEGARRRCPTRPAPATRTTTRRCRSSPPTTTRRTARSICRRRRRCRCSAATASATSTRSISRTSRCRRAAPATAPSTRATGRRSSARPGRRAARRCSKRGSAIRGRRPARIRRRSAPTARWSSSACRGCRTIRASPAACRRWSSTGYSDLGRQATNPQWQYPTVYNPKVNYTWTTRRALVQERLRVPAHRHRSAGRQPALRPRHLQRVVHAAGRRRRRATSTTSPTSCSACARSTRSAACSSRTCAATCTSPTCRTTGARASKLTLNLGLRYEYSTPYWEQDNILSNYDPGDQRDRQGDGRLDRRPRADRSGSQQLRSAPRLRLHASTPGTVDPRRLRRQLRALQPRRRRRHPADQRSAGGQRRRQPDRPDGAVVRAGGAGLSRRGWPIRRSSIR